MNLKGLVADNPTLALEFFARKADPAYFGGEASPNIKTPVMILEEKINDRIKELLDTDPFLENKETIIPPTEGSIKRFRGFMTEIPNIIFPSIFSSKTGLIRARWMEGASKTLWLSFPEKSNMPLSYSISIPRVGELGLCKINGVCLVEKDIPYIAQLMGIFIQSS